VYIARFWRSLLPGVSNRAQRILVRGRTIVRLEGTVASRRAVEVIERGLRREPVATS
jgi:hypothetical protein